jgi:sulfur carrier protein ThiS
VDVAPGQTVAAVMRQLGIPAERTKIVFVDHCAAGLDHPLAGGERIDLFSAIGGG